MLLETYSSLDVEELKKGLPTFLRDVVDVTGKPEYSMFNLSLRDESYDAKFYKYAAHGNKQQPPTSLSPLNSSNGHCHIKSNGAENRPASASPLLSPSACSPVSPSSDDVLIALTSSAIRRAAANGRGGGGIPAPAPAAAPAANGCSNGLNGSSSSSTSSGGSASLNGCGRINSKSTTNGHVHLD